MDGKDVHPDVGSPDQGPGADSSASLQLEIAFLKQSEGIERVVAQAVTTGLLRVQIDGNEGAIRTVTARTLAGPIDAVLQGRPVRLRHFTVLNQGNRQSIVMLVKVGPVPWKS
jgi:hypothetical protein